MRLSSLIRKRIFQIIPARAGIRPSWDRPDPPDYVKTPRTRRMTSQQQHFSFLSATSPAFMMVNPEAGLGDWGQALPGVAKSLGQLILVCFAIGSLGYLWHSQTQIIPTYNYLAQIQALQKEKKWYESKYGLQDIRTNPWKLNAWPESFPIRNNGIQQQSNFFIQYSKSVNFIRQINKEALSYWNKLYAQSQQSLKKGSKSHH